MELIDHIGELIREPSQSKTNLENDLVPPQPSVAVPASTNDRLVDGHINSFYELVQAIRWPMEHRDFVNAPLLIRYRTRLRVYNESCKGSSGK